MRNSKSWFTFHLIIRLAEFYAECDTGFSSRFREHFPRLAMIFPQCHFKFISSTEGENDPHHVGILNFLPDGHNEHQFFQQISFLNVPVKGTKTESSNASENAAQLHHHKTSRFYQCFIHVYVDDDLSDLGKNYKLLDSTMGQLRQVGEWPDHCVFMGNFQKYTTTQKTNQMYFYKRKLPHSFARGLLLVIDIEPNFKNYTTHRICILCFTPIQDIKLTSLWDKNAYQTNIMESLNFKSGISSRGSYIVIPRANELFYLNQACGIANPNFKPKYAGRRSSICALYVLKKKFNITFFQQKPLENVAEWAHFEAVTSLFVGTGNLRNFFQIMSWERIPYDVRKTPLTFVGFQAKPRIQADMLIKPYTWPSWTIFILTVLAFAVLNTLSEVGKLNFKIFLKSMMSLFSVALEQQVVKALGAESKAVSLCWLIWTLIMMVFSTGYKAMIFSYITKVHDARWPATLHELVQDTSYLL